jgi:putative ABC transport system substrate-binding protein
MLGIKRRDFVTLLGGAAAWPLAAGAQQASRTRRVGVLMQFPESDTGAQARVAEFRKGLSDLGWIEGRNISFEFRWVGDSLNPDLRRKYANELVALAPDVILAPSAVSVQMLQQLTRTIPIVFVGTIDPVGGGLVASLARPESNATGFVAIEYGIGAKWLELLKQIAPSITRVAVLRAATIPGSGQFGAIQSVAPIFGVDVRPIEPRQSDDVERAVTAFATGPNAGLIATVGGVPTIYRKAIIDIAARYRLPAVYSDRDYVTDGGLICYAPVRSDYYRRAAGYVDRILKGEKPADLPVQAPTKYELVINLKTAKALGLAVPPSIRLRADEVIE